MLRIKTEIYRNREKVSVDQAKPGDVICYGSGEETSAAGIYVGDGKMVQASETRGKVVTVR